MPVSRLFALVLSFGLLAGLIQAADEPAEKKADTPADAASKSPSDKADAPSDKSSPTGLKPDDEYYELFRSFADTIDQVERNYVQEVDRRELMEAAIKGVLSKLDPYSSYISPQEISGFKTSVESQFGGVGIQITIDEGQLKVLSPLVGTPAYRAGIQAGDRIIKIEGEPTKGIDVEGAVRRLKGEAGTTVTFTVVHALDNREETVSLKREVIQIDTVLGDTRKPNDEWDYMLDADKRIGYIRLSAFSRDTASDLKKALDELALRKMRGLILDLRFNPGGLLNSAVDVSDMFLPDGKIVSTKGRSTTERSWDAKKEGTYEGFPMVVLVNRYSASASEIVAAALQDHKRAIVIGDRTWGKGSVQNVIELENGKSALKLTTAGYQRPNGHNIHRFPDAKETDEWGVKPNDGYEIKLSDRELRRLVDYRRQRDILAAKPRGSTAPQPKPEETKPDATKNGQPNSEKAGEEKPKDEGKKDEPAGEDTKKDGADSKKPDSGEDAKKTDESKKDPPTPANGAKKDDGKAESKSEPPAAFVDRQLKKAIEYLTSEIARAP
jgi:carboxyl-terminal processing protease